MNYDSSRVRQEFDHLALLSVDQPEERRYHDWLLRHVPEPCEHVLEIGCGAGSLCRALADLAISVHGVDLSPNMIRLARERSTGHPNITFTVGDFMSLELPANHFDCIAAVAILHHLPWDPAVDRAKRLLRVGGALLIVDLFEGDGLMDLILSGVAWAISQDCAAFAEAQAASFWAGLKTALWGFEAGSLAIFTNRSTTQSSIRSFHCRSGVACEQSSGRLD